MDGTQGNTQDDEIEMTPAQLAADAAADALFEAGFNTASGDEPSTEASTSNAPAAASTTAAMVDPDDLETDPATGAPLVSPAAAAASQPNDDDAPVTLTRRQLAELTGTRDVVMTLQNELRQSVEKTNGRFGSLQQMVTAVREQASKGIRPSFDDMAELEEEFPEMAKVLKRNLEKMYGVGNATQPEGPNAGAGHEASGAAAPGAQADNPLEAPEVREALKQANLAVVDARHDGWRALPATPEWQTWANQLPPVHQELLRTTRDAATLSDAIDDFKSWNDQRQKAATSANQRGKRLENAIPATTGSSTGHAHIPNEDEAFEAGFNKQARR